MEYLARIDFIVTPSGLVRIKLFASRKSGNLLPSYA